MNSDSVHGLLIERLGAGTISLSHPQYAKDLEKMDIQDFIIKGKIQGDAQFRTAPRQELGAPIWPRQTRRDIGYDIAKLATDAVAAVTDVELGKKITLLYNKIVRFSQLYDRALMFDDPEPANASYNDRLINFKESRIICFTDE